MRVWRGVSSFFVQTDDKGTKNNVIYKRNPRARTEIKIAGKIDKMGGYAKITQCPEKHQKNYQKAKIPILQFTLFQKVVPLPYLCGFETLSKQKCFNTAMGQNREKKHPVKY